MSEWKSTPIRTSSYEGKCRRGYFRVETWLPLRLRRVTSESAERLARELEAPAEESAAVSDPVLEARLCTLESKLDQLLIAAGQKIDEPLGKTPKRSVQLSGSGLRAEVPGVLRRGDVVRVELELPEERGRTIQILADVVSGNDRRDRSGGKGVAVHFRSIRHRDREAIVRHAYEVQRLDLGKASGRESLR